MIAETLKSLKDKLFARRNAAVAAVVNTWYELVRRAAKGEDIPVEELESIVDSTHESVEPLCQKNPEHGKAVYSSKDGGTWTCQTCAHSWPATSPRSDVGQFSIERFERETELLKQRIQWRKDLDSMPGIQTKLDKLNAKIADAWKRKVEAEQAAKQLELDLAEEKVQLETGIRIGESGQRQLQITYANLYPEAGLQEKSLGDEMRQISTRISEIRELEAASNGGNSTTAPSVVLGLNSQVEKLQSRRDEIRSQLNESAARQLQP